MTIQITVLGPETEWPVGLIPSKEEKPVLKPLFKRFEDEIKIAESTTQDILIDEKVNIQLCGIIKNNALVLKSNGFHPKNHQKSGRKISQKNWSKELVERIG